MFLREKLPFFHFILKEFFSKQRKRYQLVCFLTRPILSPNSFGALHPQFDETVFECHFLFFLTLQVQVSSCLLPNFGGNFGACKISKLPLNTSVDPQALWIPDTYVPSCVNFFLFYENHTICFIQVGTLQIVFMPKSTFSDWLPNSYVSNCMFLYETYNLTSTNSYNKHTSWTLPVGTYLLTRYNLEYTCINDLNTICLLLIGMY